MLRELLSGTGFCLFLPVALGSCGARTELLIPEICRVDGSTRPCANVCGSGQQTCSNGIWGACSVAVATRGCSDACGAGAETCSDGAWGACQVPDVLRACSSACGPGNETCRNGAWGKCDAPQPKPPQLQATIRDFSPTTQPDFEADYMPGLDTGIVARVLGPDDKPVYAGGVGTKSTSGAKNFDEWYRDEPPLNESAPLDLQLAPSKDDPGSFVYENRAFFPIDGQLLGNEGRNHNFHFTLEASSSFAYRGGEVFSFSGDDDMWVFINRQLAIDLGGLHSTLSATVSLDAIAAAFGLKRGNVYPLHFFFAERHTTQSTFVLRTSIADPGSCD